MKRFLTVVAGLAILTGAPALAQPVNPAPQDSNILDARESQAPAPIDATAQPPLADSDSLSAATTTVVANNAGIGEPPAAYPVCRTHGQDRCRVASQTPAYALGETPPVG